MDLDPNRSVHRIANCIQRRRARWPMQALDDSDLFEELTAVALVRAALDARNHGPRSGPSGTDDEICLILWSRLAPWKRPPRPRGASVGRSPRP